jgi:hypothetical protein
MAIIHKAADEIRIMSCFKTFKIMKINELVVSSNKLTNHFPPWLQVVSGQMWTARPPVGPPWKNY